MDPASQGLLGAIVAQSAAKRHDVRLATFAGFIAGIVPDADVLIRSSTDPLLRLEYHRHFTHSLFFSPIGGAIAAIIIWLLLKEKPPKYKLYLFATLGYASHGLLDACTSYGTHLLWPFSHERISWNIISIVDPVFTIALLIFVVLAGWRRIALFARAGICLACIYLGFGAYQHYQADMVTRQLAETRGHSAERVWLRPTIGNLFLWRSVYESNNILYANAVYVSPIDEVIIKEGDSTAKIDPETAFPALGTHSVQRNDLRRFAFFSKGYLGLHPDYPNVVGDLRYSSPSHKMIPIWGITIDPTTPDKHVVFSNFRGIDRKSLDEYWLMLQGRFRP